ncbi:MAG: DUF4315 family protein [Lachnospiraceae bacterium]|nr:DUF4315 family protein [Lachnospiraceae bacterium]
MEGATIMYEKLDKLRADLERAKQKRDEAISRVKTAEDKLREAENSQVLADVSALNLTPEQLAQFLQLVSSGQLPMNTGIVPAEITNEQITGSGYSAVDTKEEEDEFDEENMEDYEDGE